MLYMDGSYTEHGGGDWTGKLFPFYETAIKGARETPVGLVCASPERVGLFY